MSIRLWLIAGICVLLAVAWLPSLAQPVLADLPPRPTAQPTASPTPQPVLPAPPALVGAPIELRVEFPQDWPWASIHWQDVWTGVQWQDAFGDWHDVEGWQGALDDVVIGAGGVVVGRKGWWVAQADLGKGPFRWVITQGKDGKSLATSAPFDLPDANGVAVTVEVSPVP